MAGLQSPDRASSRGLIDLLGDEDDPVGRISSPGEISLFGSASPAHPLHPAGSTAQHAQPPPAGGGDNDPFAAFEFAGAQPQQQHALDTPGQHASSTPGAPADQQPAAAAELELPAAAVAALELSAAPFRRGGTADDAAAPHALSPAERAARLAAILQQHCLDQGESTARLRLHLATVAAKQVKVRRMLADVSSEVAAGAASASGAADQHVAQLTARLQASAAQLAAAQQEAAAARAAAAKADERASGELAALRSKVAALQDGEVAYQAEIQGLQERLLETEATLSRLTGELPGGSKRGGAGGSGGGEGDGDGSSSQPSSPASAALAGAGSGGEVLPVTPTTGQLRRGSAVGGPGRSGSMLTPDQAAAAQLKSWLQQSQAALMEAQEELLAREAEVKQLQQQLQQQQQQQPAPAEQQQQEQLTALQAAVEAAEAAAAAASAERGQLSEQLGGLKAELEQLRSQLTAADTARADAVAALETLQQQQAEAPPAPEPEPAAAHAQAAEEAAAAAERAAAAEAELQRALAAAAQASSEVAELQLQLKRLQDGQQQGTDVAAGESAAPQPQPPLAAGAELLEASTRVEALQAELSDTRQRMLLLLRLIKKAAAAAGGGSDEALSPGERSQLASLLLSADGGDAAGGSGGKQQQQDLAVLHELLQGLQWRYGQQPQQLAGAVMRGRELQLLLQGALAAVHTIKAEAGGGACVCPSAADYAQLQLPPEPEPQQHQQQQHHSSQQPPDAAAADWHQGAPSNGDWAAGDDWQDAAAPAPPHQQQQHGGGGMLPADERLGYDGLDGAWWAQSSVEPVGDLPEFLRK